MASSGQLRAVIIGAGLMGQWHADAVAQTGHRVIAIVDPDLLRAKNLAKRVGARIASASVESLPAALTVDIAHVCTPLATHDTIARLALARGWHAIVEKPLTNTAIDAAELLQAGVAANRMIVPVHQFLFQRGVLDLDKILSADRRQLLHLDIVACTAGAVHSDVGERDNVALSILPHGLALARRLAAMPVGDSDWTVLHTSSGEIRCVTQLGDATVSLLVSTGGRPPVNRLQAVLRDRTVEVDLFHGYAVTIRGGIGRAFKMVRPFAVAARTTSAATRNGLRRAVNREMAYPGLRELVRRFYSSVADAGPPPISSDETLDVARARDRISIMVSAALARSNQ